MRMQQLPGLPSLPSSAGSMLVPCPVPRSSAEPVPRSSAEPVPRPGPGRAASLPGRWCPVPAASSPGATLPVQPRLAGKSWPKLERREVGHGPGGVGGDTDPSHLLLQLLPH